MLIRVQDLSKDSYSAENSMQSYKENNKINTTDSRNLHTENRKLKNVCVNYVCMCLRQMLSECIMTEHVLCLLHVSGLGHQNSK